MDTRNCEDMDKHICTGGDQPWKQGCGTKMLRHYTTGCRMRRKRIWSTNMIRVRMWVQGLGRGWAAVCGAAGLGCFAVMAQSWTNCVGVVELSATAVQGCMRRDSTPTGATAPGLVITAQAEVGRYNCYMHKTRQMNLSSYNCRLQHTVTTAKTLLWL